MTMLPMNPAALRAQMEAQGWIGRCMVVLPDDTGGEVQFNPRRAPKYQPCDHSRYTIHLDAENWPILVCPCGNVEAYGYGPLPFWVDPTTPATPGTCPEPDHKETP